MFSSRISSIEVICFIDTITTITITITTSTIPITISMNISISISIVYIYIYIHMCIYIYIYIYIYFVTETVRTFFIVSVVDIIQRFCMVSFVGLLWFPSSQETFVYGFRRRRKR